MTTHTVQTPFGPVAMCEESAALDDQQEAVERNHPFAVDDAQRLANERHQILTVHPTGAAAVITLVGKVPVYPRKVVFPGSL